MRLASRGSSGSQFFQDQCSDTQIVQISFFWSFSCLIDEGDYTITETLHKNLV